MLGSARKFAAPCAALLVLALPAVAVAGKPSTAGGGKKTSPTWNAAYTYQGCFDGDLTATQDAETIQAWDPTTPDPKAILTPVQNDGDDPGAASIQSPVRTSDYVNTSEALPATPPVFKGFEKIDDTDECSGTASSSASTGALSLSDSWAAMSTDPFGEGAASSGAGVYRLVSVPKNSLYRTIKATAVFTTAADAFAATKAAAAYSEVGGHLFIRRLGCTTDCPIYWDDIVLAIDSTGGYAEVAPGDHKVVLTLTAPAGQTLPDGTYQVGQILHAWVDGYRIEGQSGSASGAATAPPVTVELS